MKVRYVVFCMLILAGVAGPAQAAYQDTSGTASIVMDIMLKNPKGETISLGSGTCILSPGSACSGIIWVGSQPGVGISIGELHPTSEFDSTAAEILYTFKLADETDVPTLWGTIYEIELLPDRSIVSGRKISIHDTLKYDRAKEYEFAPRTTTNLITLQYRVVQGEPKQVTTYGRRTLTVTAFDRSVKRPSVVSQTKQLFVYDARRTAGYYPVTNPYQSTFDFGRMPREGEGSRDTAVIHKVMITFDPPLDPNRYPAKSIMHLNRYYSVDTVHTPGSSAFNYGMGYGTSVEKEVGVVPGKMLKFVFPPDLRQFPTIQIEDTIIIVP